MVGLGPLFVALAARALGERLRSGRRTRRSLDGIAATTLASLKHGDRACVTATADVLGETLTSPINRRSCIAFHVVIEERRPSSGQWEPALVRSACAGFRIVDGDLEAAVEGPFQLDLDPDDRGSIWANLPPTLFALLDEEDIALTSTLGGEKSFRFSEALLLPGDRISLFGRAEVEPDPAGVRDEFRGPPMRCTIKGSDHEPVVLNDAEELEIPA